MGDQIWEQLPDLEDNYLPNTGASQSQDVKRLDTWQGTKKDGEGVRGLGGLGQHLYRMDKEEATNLWGKGKVPETFIKFL